MCIIEILVDLFSPEYTWNTGRWSFNNNQALQQYNLLRVKVDILLACIKHLHDPIILLGMCR